MRHDRNLTTTEEYPTWLTGQARRSVRRQPAAPMASIAADPSPTDGFTEEMERLSPELSESDRDVLLALARKLAGG